MFLRFRLMMILLIGLTLVGCKHEMTDQERLEQIHGKLKKVVPVGGTVLVNGNAQTGIVITMYTIEELGGLAKLNEDGRQKPKPVRSTTTSDDGSFGFTTYVNADGVEPGKYKLTFQWFDMVRDKKLGLKPKGTDKLNGAYADPVKSEYVLTIEEGEPQADLSFDLKANS